MLALESAYAGRFRESLAICQDSLAAYDEVSHRDLRHRFGHDHRAASLIYKAWNQWYLGYSDQASLTIEDSLRWADKINHANTTGITLCYGAALVNIWLRRPAQVESVARGALRLSEEMTLALWHAWALIHLGWALSQQGKAPGLDEIEAGLKEAHQLGAARLMPLHLMLAAETYARVGRHRQDESRIDLAFVALDQGHHASLAADLHRMRAALLLRADASQLGPAEADIRRALEIARRHESPALQLRAARDLARLLAECGERRQAADLLAPIHGWFTEGFDTPDLVEAKALLAELGD